MRVKFYREHKFVCAALNDLERLIAQADFRSDEETQRIQKTWQGMCNLLQEHARYEEEKLHSLLEKKSSDVHLKAHEQHEAMDAAFPLIDAYFETILQEKDSDKRLERGYELYLTYRKFVADNLHHLHEEETRILPELQRLYSDEELRKVEHSTYQIMTAEQLYEMMQVLFPHMNPSDHEAFIEDVKLSQPEKFEQIKDKVEALELV